MKAIVYEGTRRVSVREVPDADPEADSDASDAPDLYRQFDRGENGVIKAVLHP